MTTEKSKTLDDVVKAILRSKHVRAVLEEVAPCALRDLEEALTQGRVTDAKEQLSAITRDVESERKDALASLRQAIQRYPRDPDQR